MIKREKIFLNKCAVSLRYAVSYQLYRCFYPQIKAPTLCAPRNSTRSRLERYFHAENTRLRFLANAPYRSQGYAQERQAFHNAGFQQQANRDLGVIRIPSVPEKVLGPHQTRWLYRFRLAQQGSSIACFERRLCERARYVSSTQIKGNLYAV